MKFLYFFREFEIKEGENGTILLNRHLKTKASYDKSIIKQLNKGMFNMIAAELHPRNLNRFMMLILGLVRLRKG